MAAGDQLSANQKAQIFKIRQDKRKTGPGAGGSTDPVPNDRPLAKSGLAPGHIKLWRAGYGFEEDEWGVWCLLGPNARPRIVRGYGGHGQLAREGRRAISAFSGSETPAFSISVRLDQRRPKLMSVADQCRNLERLMGFNAADDNPPPDLLFVANVTHDAGSVDDTGARRWACESFDWGDSVSTDRGTLLWQDATMVLGLQREGRLPTLGRARGFVTKTLPAGKSLRWFAREHLGDASRWTDVAALNRDNSRCPSTSDYPVKKPVPLLVPPRDKATAKKAKK